MSGRILALDYGERRIGAALSDPAGILATPFCTWDTRETTNPIEAICRTVEEEGVDRILVGHPLHTDGSISAKALVTEAFAEKLRNALPGIPVELADERYTSVEAQSLLMSRKKKKQRDKGVVDRLAAAILLQDYLNDPLTGKPSA